jgi:glycosyltransferase involved in cell wall biosynthesis
MTRILFILPKASMGGAERQMVELIRSLPAERYEIYLGLLYRDGHEKMLRGIGAEIIYFRKAGKYDFSIYLRIAEFIRNMRIDIVQCFVGNHNALLPSLLAPCKAIGGVRNSQRRRGILPMAERLLARNMIFVANSQAGRDAFVSEGFPPGCVRIIGNSIDLEKYSSGNRRKIRNEFRIKSAHVVGSVGRLIEAKNHASLISMLPQLPDTHLIVAGDGPMKERLMLQAESIGVGDRVTLTGIRDDIPDILHTLDVFLFPSRHQEGWPNALGEAMAAGLPAVSMDVGDTSRMIENGIDGIIVHDEEEMLQAARQLIEDRRLAKALGRRARRKMQSSQISLANSYDSLYQEVLA